MCTIEKETGGKGTSDRAVCAVSAISDMCGCGSCEVGGGEDACCADMSWRFVGKLLTSSGG